MQPSGTSLTRGEVRDRRSDEDIARHPIRRAAETAGLHPQTLREYERRGLIRPARTSGGMRLYRDRDIEMARHVRELTDDGFGFKAIERIVGLEARVRRLIAHVRVVEDQNLRLSARLTAASGRP